MDINVVGGCYREVCHWPPIDEVYGSAGRAAAMIAQLGQGRGVTLHTVGSELIEEKLKSNFSLSQCSINIHSVEESPVFIYEHPLGKPRISPPLAKLGEASKAQLKVKGINIVCFGMLEAETILDGSRVVYDPQNAQSPIPFSSLNASTKELVIVLNQYEAFSMFELLKKELTSKPEKVEDLAEYILMAEQAECVIVKCGQKGAFVCSKQGERIWVPAFETDAVYPIGSGDSFVAAFSFFWMNEGQSFAKAAHNASVATAFYCHNRTFPDKVSLSEYEKTLSSIRLVDLSSKSVYLAGPFFNLPEMWLVNQARHSLLNTGLRVFSPFHDVGPGAAEEVVEQDIAAIENCDVLFALLDGKDPGTIFEIGYAIKCDKPVVIFAEKATEEELKMFQGTNCVICNDYSTAVYKACWSIK